MKLVSLFSMSFCFVTTHLTAAPPVNDNKASATVISGNGVVVHDDCAEATVEPGDFAQKTQWWQWTAPAGGRVTLDTIGSAAPHLALHIRLKESSGAVTGLVASNPGALYDTNYRPSVSFPVVMGTTYLIGTGTVNTSTTTQFRLELILDTSSVIHSMPFTQPVTMANDLFSQRLTLTGHYAAGMAYNASATTEAGEPVESGLRTFWWTYTPSSNGRLSLSTVNGDAIGKNIVIYMGSEVNSLKVLESKTTGYGSGDISITLPVTADTTYQISLGSFQNATTSGALVLSLALDTSSDVSGLNIPDAATLANDMFAARVSLSGAEVSAIGHSRPASNEAGEPAALGTKTLWWKYRPSANGRLTITTDGSSPSRKNVGVYLGESLALLRQAAFGASGHEDANPTITLPVTVDTDYQIGVGAHNDEWGHVVLTLSLNDSADVSDLNIPIPASVQNDAFAQRPTLTGREVSAIGYTGAATNEIGEPSSSGAKSLWWRYRSPAAGRLTVSTQGSGNYDKTVAVYQGETLVSLKLVANGTSQYNSSNGNVVTLSFPVTADTDYQVSLGNIYQRDGGDAAVISFSLDDECDVNELNLGAAASAFCDLFASSTMLTGEVVSGIAYNTGADREALEPAATKERTVWWSWTAPSTGLAMVDTAGSDVASQKWASVWVGSSLSSLSQVAVSARSTRPSLLFPVTAGETYRIAVGNDSSGSFTTGSIIMSIVTASSAPVLAGPLESRLMAVNQPLILNATAGGLGLSWQWSKDGSVIGSAITATYSKTFASLSDAGVYTAAVAGPGGTAQSTANIGIVNTTPEFVSANEGGNMEITVSAQGPVLGYQWFRDGVALSSNDSRISGVDGFKLSINGMTALDAGVYHCAVSMPDAQNPGVFLTMNSGTFTVSGSFKPVAFGGPYVWHVGRAVTDVIGTRFAPTRLKIAGLPAGVSYNEFTGQLSGVPTAAVLSGSFRVTAFRGSEAGPERGIAYTVVGLDPNAMGTFNGLVEPSDEIAGFRYGGSLKLVVTSSGAFTCAIKFGGSSHSAKGRLEDDGQGTASQTVSIPRKGGIPLSLFFQIDLSNGHLSGTLSEGTKGATIEAWRVIWSKNLAPGQLATTYTAALMPPDPAPGETTEHPRGDGVSFVSINSLGVVTWKGTLADGSAITASTTLGPDGQIPLFAMPYKSTAPGSVIGWITASQHETSGPLLDGSTAWTKSPQTSGSMAYRGGFETHTLTVAGGAFLKPGGILWGMQDKAGNTRLTFAEGGLAEPVSTLLQINAQNKPILKGVASPAKLAVKLNVKSGLISGSFEIAETPPSKVKRKVKFLGALVNRLNAGTGHFLLPELPGTSKSPVLSGWMELAPEN